MNEYGADVNEKIQKNDLRPLALVLEYCRDFGCNRSALSMIEFLIKKGAKIK